jgi:hypothetical protein
MIRFQCACPRFWHLLVSAMTTPILLARWWESRYDSILSTNAWILSIVDIPSTAGQAMRTLSCWLRRSTNTWIMDGTNQSITISYLPLNSSYRLEFQILPAVAEDAAKNPPNNSGMEAAEEEDVAQPTTTFEGP